MDEVKIKLLLVTALARVDEALILLSDVDEYVRDIEKSPVPCPKCKRVDGLMWNARPKIWRCVWKDCEYIL